MKGGTSWAFAVTVIVATVALPATSWSLGVCLEATDSCTDYYLEIVPEAGDINRVHGYEYGCGTDLDLVSGTMRRTGGTAYIGLTGSKGGVFDSGYVYQANYVIETLSQSGTYEFFSTYLDAGVLSGSGGGGTAILFICSDPGQRADEEG